MNSIFNFAQVAPTSIAQIEQVRDVSLGEMIRQDVLASILRGELSPGDRINEPDVAARLGVSRVPVREALKALESSGLVYSKKHAGVFVRAIDAREVADLYQLRASIDSLAGRLLVRRMLAMPKAKQVKELFASLESSIQTMDTMTGKAYYHENLRFHWMIVEGAANKSAADMYEQIVHKLHVARLGNLSDEKNRIASSKEHRQIVKAIRSGEEQVASQVLQAHVEKAHERGVDISKNSNLN